MTWKEPFGNVLLTGPISKGSTQFDSRQSGNICTKALHLWNATSTKKRDKYTAGRAMTGQSGGKKHSGRKAASRRGEGVRQRGGMMCLTVSVGFLLNKLLPQILGACADKFGLIKVTEMPACLHTSIKHWYICHSQWKSSKGF